VALTPGTRLGAYELIAAIGAGGMGEVYRARDTRLNRDVAIKALPALVANDPERVARFEREAQLLAALNHPHIAAIYGVEEQEGSRFLVLELVEGESLAARLTSGPVPLDDAIEIGREIADALAAAHDKGIIHRDLKPANVMLTAGGRVKVLDFGLAKALGSEGASATADAMNSPTLTAVAPTEAGMILGTAAYMSPEQAKGRPADKRSDVWAFGCVLFELLTGKRTFTGEDVSETLAAVLRADPDWSALPKTLPPTVRALLEGALVKQSSQRLADISTAQFLLSPSAIAGLGSSASAARAAPGRRSARLGLVAAAVVGAAMAAIAFWALRPTVSAGSTRLTRLAFTLPAGDQIAALALPSLALSPDGTQVVYSGLHEGTQQLFVRALDSAQPMPLAGTEGASMPFFSPDGRWVAFFALGQMKKVSVTGSGLQTLCPVGSPRGGSWGADGTIYFAPSNISGLSAVSSAGGTPREITHLDVANSEVSHRWPQLLPGGTAVLFSVWTGPGWDEHQIVVQSLSSGERRVLVRGGSSGIYVSGGYLVYSRADALFAVPMDLGRLEVGNSAPVALTEQVRDESDEGAHFAVSDTGGLIFLAGGASRLERTLVWVDRAGHSTPLPVPPRHYSEIALSPDGRQVALQIEDGTHGIWIYDLARTTLTPFVVAGGSSQAPLWTPDGTRIVYRGTRNGFRNLFWKAVDGTSPEERLTTKAGTSQTPGSWSADGQTLVYSESSGAGDLWSLHQGQPPQPVLATPDGEGNPRLSPDSRWLAYHSNASGRPEVYVQPFPGPGPRETISVGGGSEPVWSSTGHELFYLDRDTMMVVDITTAPKFMAGAPRRLFQGQYKASTTGTSSYAVSRDGQRFLRIQSVRPEQPPTEIHVVLNWVEELHRLSAR
jgi:serine/threonine-protein kinase